MWRELKSGDVRRQYPEEKLREMAEDMCDSLVMREWVNGSSHDTRRPTSDEERELLCNVAFDALKRLNADEYVLSDRKQEQAIIDAVEFEFVSNNLIPGSNSYDTVYIPLKIALGEWELEPKPDAQARHSLT